MAPGPEIVRGNHHGIEGLGRRNEGENRAEANATARSRPKFRDPVEPTEGSEILKPAAIEGSEILKLRFKISDPSIAGFKISDPSVPLDHWTDAVHEGRIMK